MPAPHLRPLLDAGQRLVVARGVFAVHGVSAASHHQLLLPREEALLQTRLPTVSDASLSLFFFFFLWLGLDDARWFLLLWPGGLLRPAGGGTAGAGLLSTSPHLFRQMGGGGESMSHLSLLFNLSSLKI